MVEDIVVQEGLKNINAINNLVEYKYPNNFIIQFLTLLLKISPLLKMKK